MDHLKIPIGSVNEHKIYLVFDNTEENLKNLNGILSVLKDKYKKIEKRKKSLSDKLCNENFYNAPFNIIEQTCKEDSQLYIDEEITYNMIDEIECFLIFKYENEKICLR